MKVKELIEKLSEIDPDAIVTVPIVTSPVPEMVPATTTTGFSIIKDDKEIKICSIK